MMNLSDINLHEIESIYTVTSAKGRQENIIKRNTYGLSFCMSGQITYSHKGKNFISDSAHAIILPMGETYSLHGDKKGLFPLINFTCNDFLCNTMILIPIKHKETYIKDFEQMKSLFLFERNKAKVKSIFYNMIHKLSCESIAKSHVLAPALEFLEKNYSSDNITNKSLADLCNISEIYFRQLFKKQFAVTPKQYVIDVRIDKAKQLLSDGFMKIGAIAEECGFSNQYHFCRIFKSRIGMTPTEYMRENKVYKL